MNECECCTGLRAQIDILERKLEETESQLGMAERKNEEQRAAFQALYKRLCVEMDDAERQIREACEVFRVDQETGEFI